jgi:hypothetical protein
VRDAPVGALTAWRSRLATWCVVLAACGVAAGCSAGLGDSDDSKGTDTSEQAGPPRVGQCYDTPDSVLPDATDPTAPVSCDRPHTLETYDVLQAESPLDRQAIARMGEQCAQGAEEFLGGDFRSSAVSIYYFSPTPAEQKQGARWVRCDVGVVTDTAVSGTRTVTGSLRDVFADGVPVEYRRCVDAPPNPGARQQLVPCVAPHVAQLMPSGVDLSDLGNRYPGVGPLTGAAEPACAQAVQKAVPGADRSLVIVPSPQMWSGGVTTAQCWALAAPGERLNDSEAQPA